MKSLRPLVAILLAACGAADPQTPTTTDMAMPPGHGATGPLAPASGAAHVFGAGGGNSVEGAVISVAEAPSITTTVAANGTFSLRVPSGGACSFVFHKAGFADNQTAALPVGEAGIEQIGFQAPTDKTFALLATVTGIEVDPARCQIATTVSRAGTAPYGGPGLGEPDAIVSITPPLPAENGPVYFRYVSNDVIYPDRKLTATTLDGGVLYANVPPGEYVLRADKPGKKFSTVKLRCRAGMLVNAAPPWGIQEM